MNDDIALLEDVSTVDFLGRGEFVEQMFTISLNLANVRDNACYALNGDWGIGKTFFLDMFQKRVEAEAEGASERFLVFRYNCWEYDYYEEPLVAIVSSMLKKIDSLSFIKEKDRIAISGILKRVWAVLTDYGINWVEKKFELDEGVLKKTYTLLKDGIDDGNTATNKAKEYDQYSTFKKALEDLREQIETLAKRKTVIFLVDELDRCLPEYAIRVLERLHHLVLGIPNVQVVLAIDRKQLEHTIKQIYGPNTDSRKYLQKFIQFELSLDAGTFQDNFDRRFARFSACFSENDSVFNGNSAEYISALLQGLDMRRRIMLVNRCEIIHKLLAGKDPCTKYNQDYLCIELFLTLLHDCEFSPSAAKEYFKNKTEVYSFFPSIAFGSESHPVALTKGLQWIWREYQQLGYNFLTERISVDSLFGCLVAIYAQILGVADSFSGKYAYTYSKELIDFGLEFWKMQISIN